MVNHERGECETDDARWLKLIGRGDLVGTELTLKNGATVQADNFTAVCPEARFMFMGLEATPPDDPAYADHAAAARAIFEAHFGEILES